MNKAAKPLKIFISYGHEIDVKDEYGKPLYPDPNNESVVLKIKAYLESRGHEVWLDKERIKEGSEWRKSIYDGVEWSDVVLICLSRKAMKPNGVCRDEISIALGVRGGNMFPVMLEELEDDEYPAYLLNRQLFARFMDWRLHWTEDSIDESWLDNNLEKLAKALEEKDVWRYGEDMVTLKKFLNPWNMSSRLKSLDRETQCLFNEQTLQNEDVTVHKFCGRKSLFQMFEGKIAQSGQAVRIKSDRVLWLKKGPGFGKSRFAAELLYRYYYAISAAYFIEYNQPDTLAPQTFIKSVAYQLAQANSSYREKLLKYLKENQDEIDLRGDPQTLFKTLVVDLLSDEIDGGRATQWILVDALDEATENGRNEIAALISQNLDRLPPWICFFITSRDRDNAVNRNFAQFTPIDFSEEENVSDVRDYIVNEFEGMEITVSEDLVNILQEKSEGTFLYPEMVFRDLKKNSFTIDDIRDLPSGVIGYIHSQFDRLFGSDIKSYKREICPMLGFILTSCEPIPRAVLKYCLGIRRDSELDDQLEMLGTFFIQSGSADEDTVVPFHKSVIDYCFDKNSSVDYYVYPEEAKVDFANRGLELYKSGALQWTTRTDEKPNIVQCYFLNWLPSHLMNANMTKEAAAVLSDFAFLMKRLRYGNVERIILDYIFYRDALKGVSKDSDSYFDVVCSNAHFLRHDCEVNPAYKIMLQFATEVADDCPVTQAAERWLNPETDESPCDWFWLNKVKRPKEYQPDPCKQVMEYAGDQAILLSNGDVLSWATDDKYLKIWDLKTGVCKAVLEGHTDSVNGAIELRSGDILSWCGGYRCKDRALRLWFPDGKCKAVLVGHAGRVNGAKELRSGDIVSWSEDCKLIIWSPEGKCKAILAGHTDNVNGAIELRSGDILSWCYSYSIYNNKDYDLRLWSPDGTCKAVLKGHTDKINGAIELRSGGILSWSADKTLRLWSINGFRSPDGFLSPDLTCKAVLEGHTDKVNGAIELRSGDILSWGEVSSMRLWDPKGKCKAVLEGHWVNGAKELRSGDILSRSGKTLCLCSPDGVYKAVLEGHTDWVEDAMELRSGDILSWSGDHTLRLWSPDGVCKSVLEGHTASVKNAIELNSGNILSSSCDDNVRLWSLDENIKAVSEGHTSWVFNALELRSGDILSWSNKDTTLRLWSPNGVCKAVLEGHTNGVIVAIELRSGDILSWSWDHTLRLWSPDGVCKSVLEGHTNGVKSAIELGSGDILSWGNNIDLRLWSPDGVCKAVLEGHTNWVVGAIEIRSGDILSWSYDLTLRLWSPDGVCKAVLEGHNNEVNGAIELRSGDILSWSDDKTLRLWSPDGVRKAVLEGHKDNVNCAIELGSGDILSWCYSYSIYNNKDYDLRLWSPDGICKAVLEGHTGFIKRAIELSSGDILSLSWDHTLRLWSPDGICKEVIEFDTPQYKSYRSLLYNRQNYLHFNGGLSSWVFELQCELKPIARWNNTSCDFRLVGDGRICVWYGKNLKFLQLNYGNHMSVSFEQARQLLEGEIDESRLVAFVPESKGTAIPKTE
ncbi:MAG: TIR domain-containing protein [Thermoguttaceae bacterium]|nr:TIR domain-containing protein [Thermoguttaceae bacterium]